MGLLEALLLFCIRRLQWILLLIVPLHVGLHILPIWIDFRTTEVNWRGLPAPQDVKVCPKLVHSSTSCGAFTLWRRPRLRRGSGMCSLTRSFWDWRRCSFRALRGVPFRATPLHSATDIGPGRVDGVWGPRELEVIHVHLVRQWCYSTQIVNASLLAEADNMRLQHLPHTPKSCPRTISKLSSCSFQVRYRRLDDTLYYNHGEIGRQ